MREVVRDDKIGNTEQSIAKKKDIKRKTKQVSQLFNYCFTFNNYEESDIVNLKIKLDMNCERYVFQEEVGESGTPHLQGSIKLIKRLRIEQLKDIDRRIYWSGTRNLEAADAYACKEDTRAGRIFKKEGKRNAFVRTKSKFDDIVPRIEVMDIIKNEPDNRTINWIWSDKGGVGKTSTAAYLERNYNGVLVVNGKGADIKNSVINYLNNNDGVMKELDVLIVNVPRCNENYVSYAALEEIKDGLIYSGKYEGGFVNIECPHIIVMCNFVPDRSKLSDDRWNVINVDVKEDVLED
jgi:hypothetical protein